MIFLIRQLLVLCMAFLALELCAQSSYSAELDNYHVEVGDSIVLRISTTNLYDRVEKIRFEVLQAVPQIERAADNPTRQFSTVNSIVFESAWIAFDTGEVELPAIPVVIAANGTTYTAYTNTLKLKITNPTIDSTDTVLAPLKEVETVQIYWYDYWPLYLNIVLALLLIYILYRVFRKNKVQAQTLVVEAPQVPALEAAMHALDELEKSKLIESGLLVLFYTELSHIYRAYVGRKFKINALESSTTEILGEFRSIDLPAQFYLQASTLMHLFDLAKFGNDPLTEAVNTSMISKTRDHLLELDTFYTINDEVNESTPVS